jgi:hypothetical protein
MRKIVWLTLACLLSALIFATANPTQTQHAHIETTMAAPYVRNE